MLIVVLIVGIAAAMVVPKGGDSAVGKLTSAAQLVAADLAFAQIESIAHGDDLRMVVVDTAASSYRIAPTSDPDTPITDPISKGPYLMTFGEGRAHSLSAVTISGFSLGGDDRVQFGVYGQLDQAVAATITLSAGGKSITITLDPVTGESTISDVN